MNRKLLLSGSSFPEKFISSSISSLGTVPKQQYMEEKVIEAINNYNTKLQVSSIEYLNIKDQFPHLNFFGKYAGIIVEDDKIEEIQKDRYIENKYFVWESHGEWYARKSVIYVFVGDKELVGRSSYSQLFFPVVSEFMGLYLSSPSFSIANHPMYYINFSSGKLPDSSMKQTAGMIASGIEYIEVFYTNSSLVDVPNSIRDFLIKYKEDFESTDITYASENFQIDLTNKITRINTNKLVLGDILDLKNGGSQYTFKGSKEKFYLIDIIPVIILSWKSRYEIDYTQLEEFYNLNIANFSPGDDKFHRFFLLIQFIKKIMLRSA